MWMDALELIEQRTQRLFAAQESGMLEDQLERIFSLLLSHAT
jgi:hypothetical protein